MKKALLPLLFLLLCIVLRAQTINGRLIDRYGHGLSGLQVKLYLTNGSYNTVSSANGTFNFNNVNSTFYGQLPFGYYISDNYPNPFNQKTRINILLPQNGTANVEVYNLSGQKVTYKSQYLNAGENYIDIELNGFLKGYYFAKFTIDDKYCVTKKMLLSDENRHSSPGFELNDFKKSASINDLVTEIKIDSLVVTGASVEKKVFRGLPNLTSNNLNLGDLIVDGANNLMDGALFYNGVVPKLGLVNYTKGATIVADSAYVGQVLVFFKTPIIDADACSLIISNGGTILAKIPNLGFYFISVPIGGERSFIDAVKLNKIVQDAFPHIIASYMSSDIHIIDDCFGNHGLSVKGVISDEINVVANCMDDDDGSGKPLVEKTIEYIAGSAKDD